MRERPLARRTERIRTLEGEILEANQRRQDVGKRIDELIAQIDQLDALSRRGGRGVMSERRVVAPVQIQGQEFRLRSDDGRTRSSALPDYVDATMARVEERTGTVDSRSTSRC